jgi:hypothetical protein
MVLTRGQCGLTHARRHCAWLIVAALVAVGDNVRASEDACQFARSGQQQQLCLSSSVTPREQGPLLLSSCSNSSTASNIRNVDLRRGASTSWIDAPNPATVWVRAHAAAQKCHSNCARLCVGCIESLHATCNFCNIHSRTPCMHASQSSFSHANFRFAPQQMATYISLFD